MPHQRLKQHAAQINVALDTMLVARGKCIPGRLWEAMHYSLMAGGKRIRPLLMLECFSACCGEGNIMPAMMSIECMHTYSLMHDDLPCMDDDDLRRGRPTCHKQFDEASAVLAADALQSLSFALLTEVDASADLRVELISRLALAAGAQGMVGGQMLDMLAAEEAALDVLEIERIHVHKTGDLLRYGCEAGAMLAHADAVKVDACSRYGKAVGLLFQIADDILDATGSSEVLGKNPGKDAAQHKATYVSLLGLERAREIADEMRCLAVEALTPLGEKATHLTALATYILERKK
ncbi:MAG: polyprenyl synthetase family protein [Mariprofundaceae bacterium]|nr:polyprenyl synthetase family protein [Mariprofundaceae bacterium]